MLLPLVLLACGSGPVDSADSGHTASPADSAVDTSEPTETGDSGQDTAPAGPDPFADFVVTFEPGEGAGYGQDELPDVVLGAPEGAGTSGGGSLDVLSLGVGGVIVLQFDDIGLVDGEGPDLIVFENAFSGWQEPGEVAVSDDGETWYAWPCSDADAPGGYPGCAGLSLVYSNTSNGIDPTDPAAAGGDAFDLSELGVERARYVRITDRTTEAANTGFDLDAVAVVNGEAL